MTITYKKNKIITKRNIHTRTPKEKPILGSYE